MSVAFGSVASGQTVTLETVTGGELAASKKNITFKNCVFTGQHVIRCVPNQNITIDGGQKVNDTSVTTSSYEGQFQLQNAGSFGLADRANILIKNFVTAGGTGDGFQLGSVKGVTFDGCEIRDHKQVSTIHADGVQVLDSQFIAFRGCWFHNNAAALMMVDWDNSDNEITDCLFTNSDGWDACMSGVPRVKFEHNTIYRPNYGTRILDDHSGNPSSSGYSLRYNALPAGFGFTLSSGSGTSPPNLSNAVYASPANPGTRAGFALANPTLAPDGTVWGSRRLTATPTATVTVYKDGVAQRNVQVNL